MDIGIYEKEKLATFLIDIEVVSYKDDLLKKTTIEDAGFQQ